MRKLKLFSLLLLLFLGVGQMWATDVTYTFTSKSWADASNAWTGGGDGNGFTSGQGIQVTTGTSGANATSKSSFSNISKVVVTYNTNKSKGAGSIVIKIGTNAEVSNSVSYSGSADGTSANFTTQFDFSPVQTGAIKITTNTTTNSIWVKSITITYDEGQGGGGDEPGDPSLSVSPTSWDFGAVATDATASKVFSISGSDLEAGTLTLTAPSGYSVSPATITVTSAGDLDATNVTVSKNTSTAGTYNDNLTISGCGLENDIEVALSMEVKAKYTVTWNNNGVMSTSQVLDGEKPVFPATPESCDATSTIFIGWATAPWTGKLENLDGKTVYTKAADMPAVDAALTYYAVFAKSSAGSAFDGEHGGIFKIYALVGTTKYYALGTVSSSKINPTEDAAEAADFEIEAVTGGFTIKSGNKYISYTSSTNLAAVDDPYTWSIVEGSHGSWRVNSGTSGRAWIYRAGTTNKFGGYSTSNVDGSEYFDLEIGGGATYSDYMTTCCTQHAVNIAAGIEHGSVSADPASACEGATITLTFTPALNYHLSAWTLNGEDQDIAENTFEMPGADVTVSATFAQDACEPLGTPSVTVSGKDYPYDAVQLAWTAIEHADAYKVYLYDNEDNELEHNDAFAGVEYTIGQTLSASTTYKYSVQAISNTPATHCPSTAAASTFTTDALPTAHLTLYALGEEHESSGDYAILTPFNLPNTAATCSKTFVGWDSDPDCETDPTFAKGAEFTFANTTGVTLYAVYATVANSNAELKVGEYAEANSWENGVAQSDFTIDGVTFTANGGGNNGKYYESDKSWRFYSGGSISLSATKNILSVSSTPNQTFTINKNSASCSLSATVKFTSITVTLEGTYSNYSTSCTEQVNTPTFTVAAGTYTTAQTVEIQCATQGATIYYTTDGTEPTTSSTPYTAAISLNDRGAYTIKAIAVKSGFANSEIASAEYKINLPFATVADLFTYLGENTTYNLGDVTVTGYVSEIVTEYSSEHNNVSYNISDDGKTTSAQLQSYRGKGVKNGEEYEDADLVAVGDKVTITGTYKVFNSTKELDANNYIITRVAKGAVSSLVVSGTAAKTEYSSGENFAFGGLVATATYESGYAAEVTPMWNANPATVMANGKVAVTATVGTVTSAAYEVDVTVSAKTLQSIAVGTASYTIYTTQVLPQPTVTATFSEGEPEEVSASAVYDSENVFDTDTPDEYTITVSYEFGGTTKTATYTVTVNDYANDADNPYTVAQAINIITNVIGTTASARDIYVQGIVSQKNDPSSNVQTYYISDNGETTGELEIYKGKYIGGANFTTTNQVLVGDEVVVGGKVKMFNAQAEFDSGSQLQSLARTPSFTIANVASFEVGAENLAVTDLTVTTPSEGDITLVSGDEEIATIVENAIHAVAPGTVTITANMVADGIYKAATTTFDVEVIAAQQRYAVTFDLNEGSANPTPSLGDQLPQDNVVIPSGTFTKEGHKFNGWVVMAGETPVVVTENDGVYSFTMPAADVTVTAQWTEVPYWATVFTSNITVGSDVVVISGENYQAKKAGSGSAYGSTTVTVPAGATKLHFHAAGWGADNTVTLAVKKGETSLGSFDLNKDTGVKSSSPFTLEGNPYDQYYSVDLSGITENTTISFTATGGYRFVLYGVIAIYPEITLSPVSYDFGEVFANATAEKEFEISTNTAVTGTLVASIIDDENNGKFSVGQIVDNKVKVTFNPASDVNTFTAKLKVEASNASVTANLTAEAIDVSTPVIEVNTNSVDFGRVNPNDEVASKSVAVTLTNLVAADVNAEITGEVFTLTNKLAENGTLVIIPNTETKGIYSETITLSATDATTQEIAVTMTVASKWDMKYTSNVTLTTEGGTSATASKVVIGDNQYDAIKAGTGSVYGVVKVTVPAKTKELHLHAAAWNGETVTLNISGATQSSLTLTADAGMKDNSPYTLKNSPISQAFDLDIPYNATATTTITLTADNSTNQSGKRFVIYGVNQVGGEIIISDDTNASNIAEDINLVVTDDVILTMNENKSLGQVTVTGGNTLTISGTGTLTAEEMIVEGEDKIVLETTVETPVFRISAAPGQNATSGQVINAENIDAQEIIMDVQLVGSGLMSANYWYGIATPFDVDVNTGIFMTDGTHLVNNTHVQVWSFAPDQYADGGRGWKRCTVMQRGKAYLIGFDQDAFNAMSKSVPNVVRLKANGALDADMTAMETHTYSGVRDYDWNGLANPNLHHINAGSDVQVFDNNETGYHFHPYECSVYSFVVGAALFVQDNNDHEFVIENDEPLHSNLQAPARTADRYSFCVQIRKPGSEYFDNQMYVRASETATATYESGKDMETLNEACNGNALIWTNAYGKRLAIEEAPLQNNQAIYNLSIMTPAAGTYVLRQANEVEGATLYVTYNGAIVWNLSLGDYELDLTRGTTTGYGLLLVAQPNQMPTGLDTTEGVSGDAVQKILLNGQLYILRDGHLFDAVGHEMK